MKYDSSMTQFRKDIIAALRLMCGNNTEITEKFSPEDGSPAPLRDYLKEKYRNMGVHSNGIGYWCTPSKGVEVYFNEPLNNDGDKNLTLSWSQATKFIRDNWDEVFKKDKPKSRPLETLVKTFDETEITCPNWLPGKTLTYLEAVNGVHFECKAFSTEFCKLDDITKFFVQHCHKPQECPYCKDSAEKQPSYIDKLREKYPKINETDDWVWGVYCPSTLFSGKNIPDTLNALCDRNKNGCKECWNSRCETDVTFDNTELDVFEDDYFEHYPEEESSEAAPENSEENSEEKSEADNSAENQIAVNTETALQGAFDYSELDDDTAKNLRDCETVIRQETAGYFTLLGAKFKEARDLLANHANGTFEKWYTAMGFKRQTVYNLIQRYDFLGSPTIGGREDTFEALPLTLSYEVSKPDAPAELVEKVLDGDITTNAEYIALKKQLEKANEQISILHSAIEKKDGEIDGAHGCIETLEKEIDELESRPVDVAVQDDSDLMEELEELREENARLKDDSVKSMVIRLTLDEYDKLLEKLGGDPCLGHIIKHAKIIKL